MTKINEILTLDLQEDMKSVIDLEDHSEVEVQQEIESYIVTEGIAKHLCNFTKQFTSNIKETGVWLSGFYGSGKSYFGKMLGYIIDNPNINGTPARERFIPRLKGVLNESLIENSIRNLKTINSRVVFIDVAKQNIDKGLAFTLFANLLKKLGFRNDIYGYMEFDLFIEGKLDEFKDKVRSLYGREWDELKTSKLQVPKLMRKTFAEMGYSEVDYDDTLNLFRSAIENFSADKFKKELERYLNLESKPDETLVFIFDEASEAISQKKFTLLDLEGISEALSSISNKVWTIAIAQENLDDVISNANVNRDKLTKVTDRFKTKVHLESTEVNVIIRSRLLHKTDNGYRQLSDYYRENKGLVSDATNLDSSFPTKTADVDAFATYYPFHKYQFDILQKFLFSSKELVATQITARGMIITTFDVLRNQMHERELYSFTPGYAICTEAQTEPPIELANKYDTAKKILNESTIDGEKLLKTIHLLANSKVVSPSVENITKSYISDITTYYVVKPVIKEALDSLLEAEVLLLSNNSYKITSDLERKLLEEMKSFEVKLFSKKNSLINFIKDYKLFTPVATFNDGSDSFKFSVLSDQDDELTGSGSKQLKLTVYSLFNISENRQDLIEEFKDRTEKQKNLITLVPDNKEFSLIDKLIEKVNRYLYMEEKYSRESDPTTDLTKRQIIRDFSNDREEKEKELRVEIEKAYRNASLIYMFDEQQLNANTFKGTISEIQRKLIKNIYTKRLSSGLSESLVPKIFKSRREDLNSLFSGDNFLFFDSCGNFTGNNLKVVEEINAKIENHYTDGRTLESELSGAPWGYSFGTIVSTLAALSRASHLSIKYDGKVWLPHQQSSIQEVFENATKFKSASFKSIRATLMTSQKKNEAVQLLRKLENESHNGRKVDWDTNDFDLADRIRYMAQYFIDELQKLRDRIDGFESLFPTVADQEQELLNYAGEITESNYIKRVESLLNNSEQFSSATQIILKAREFIDKKNFSKVKKFKSFIEKVVSELKKANLADSKIQVAHKEFSHFYKQDMVKNFSSLQQQFQIVKDSYYEQIKKAAAEMSNKYQLLREKFDAALRTLRGYPTELNARNQRELDELKCYCSDRIIKEPNLEYAITCRTCGYSLSDILNYTELAPNKESKLQIIQSNFIAEALKPELNTGSSPDQPPAPKKPRKVRFQITNRVMTVREYKSLLTAQLTSLAAARLDEKIELDIETL